MALLDFIFPKRCVNCRAFGSYICSDCFSYVSFSESGTCFVCQRGSLDFLTHPGCRSRYALDGAFSSLVYKGVVKRLVYKFKYKPHLTDLKSALIDLFYEGIIQKEILYKLLEQQSVIIPIPLYKGRYRKRGYNQAEILSKALGRRLDIPVLNFLERVKNTKTQVGLKKKEREENIKGAFVIKPKFEIRNSKLETNSKLENSNAPSIADFEQVFLVDDVATSGATLKEAASVLKRAHSASSGRAGELKVYGLTLAHGQ